MGASDALDMRDLDALANAPLTVTVGGRVRHTPDGPVDVPQRVLSVTPVEVIELPAMLRACQPVFGLLAGGDLMSALLKDPEAVIAAIAVGARLPRSEMDALDMAELVALGSAVIQVNADFFVRRVTPALVEASQKVALALAGSMASPAS